MNEPKRRGRPPKIGNFSEAPAVEGRPVDKPIQFYAVPVVEMKRESAQAYASRVWAGQSPSEPRSWRIERVKAALEGQGLSFDGVVLP